jgi:hypothetical protein
VAASAGCSFADMLLLQWAIPGLAVTSRNIPVGCGSLWTVLIP